MPDFLGEMSLLGYEKKLRCQLAHPCPSKTYVILDHHNVQNLRSHSLLIKLPVIYERADVIFPFESWLNCFDNSSQLDVPGFVMHDFGYP